MFEALVLRPSNHGLKARIERLDDSALPEGDTLVSVLYSSLNYKDALAVTGRGKIIRGTYPFIAGIDLVARVEATESTAFVPGDLVLGTGWGLGEHHWGGYSERQRVRAEWLVPLPADLAPTHAMSIGTAGLTAMLSVFALQEAGIRPHDGKVLVTGASGGVGGFGVALLSRFGYRVVASTGDDGAIPYLRRLGASEIISRDEVALPDGKPLASARWSGAIDVVGGRTLASIIASLERHGAVAACGLTGGAELHTTVYPFILRGVSLMGIDSNTCPQERRLRAWQSLAAILRRENLDEMMTVIGLKDVPAYSERLLAGEIRGRLVVDVTGSSKAIA